MTAPAATCQLPSLVHYLNEALRHAEDDEEPRDYLGISQLGRCARASGFALRPQEYPALVQVESLRFWHEGHLSETDIIERLRAGGCPVFDCQKEVTFPATHALAGRVRGHIDGKVPLAPSLAVQVGADLGAEYNGPLAILEIKSLRFGALKKLASEGTVSQGWPHYGIQAHTYAWCERLDWVAFLLKDRNDGTIVECWEPLRLDLVEQGVAQGLRVLSALDAGQLPGRDYEPASDWQCKSAYCQFRTYCLEAGR